MTKLLGQWDNKSGPRKRSIGLVLALAAGICCASAAAQAQVKFDRQAYEALENAGSGASIAVGTKITLENWTRYKRFMPVGMQALFGGSYPWKIDGRVEYSMEVGPTIPIPLSRKYLADTEKYGGQVRLKKLPTGGHTVENYVAGVPFPNPTMPELGTKLMYDLWFPYSPFVFEVTYVSALVDGYNNSTRNVSDTVVWRLNHLSDEGKPQSVYTPGYLEGNLFIVLEPQQMRYTTQLTLQPDNPEAMREAYVFAPTVRRPLRMSTSAHCASMSPSDYVQDDNGAGFFFQASNFKATFLGLKRILAMVHQTAAGQTPEGYLMNGSLPGWPKPTAGKWEVRDTYVIDVTPLPAAGDYCYLHKVAYIDKETYALTWMEMYGRDSDLWKVWMVSQSPKRLATGEEVLIHEAFSTTMLNFKIAHATVSVPGSPVRIDNDVRSEMQDAAVAASSAGLAQIMK